MPNVFIKYNPVTVIEGGVEKLYYNIAGVYYLVGHFKCKTCDAVAEPVQVKHEAVSVFGSIHGGIFGLYCETCKEIRAEEGAVFKVV